MAQFRKDLSKEQIQRMRNWARKHPEYLLSYPEKIGIWHPVVLAEYNMMVIEKNSDCQLNHFSYGR